VRGYCPLCGVFATLELIHGLKELTVDRRLITQHAVDSGFRNRFVYRELLRFMPAGDTELFVSDCLASCASCSPVPPQEFCQPDGDRRGCQSEESRHLRHDQNNPTPEWASLGTLVAALHISSSAG
jgi:hypothetical protein